LHYQGNSRRTESHTRSRLAGRLTSSLVLLTYSSALLSPSLALAAQSVLTDTSAINGDAIAAGPVNCDQACSLVLGPDGQAMQWGTDNDQWCSNHGVTTNGAVPPNLAALPVPTAAATAPPCNVTLLPSDYATPAQAATACSTANTMMNQCKFHNGMLLPQCLAYDAARGALKYESTLLVMDEATAAFCGAVCATQWTVASQTAQLACDGLGAAASVAEIVDDMESKSSPLQHDVNELEVAEGLAAAGDTIVLVGATTKTGSVATGKTSPAQKASSCITSIAFLGLSVLRINGIKTQNRSKGNACSAIQNLVSSASVTNPGGSPQALVTPGPGDTTPGYQNMNPSTAGATAGTNAPLNGGSGNTATTSATVPPCVADQGLVCAGQQGAATDAGLLTQSGLDKTVAPLATQIASQPNAMTDPAAAISAAMGDKASGDVGTALANIANTAMKEADKLAGIANLGSYASGGSSGAAPSLAKMSSLLSNMGGAVTPSGETTFNKTAPALLPANGDIWHADWKGSIFQLISTKIGQNTQRVETLDWDLPLNRALMGLPQRKPASTPGATK